MPCIEDTTKTLYKCFDRFNKHFFDGKLPEPAITIQSKGKRNALGWCSTGYFWENEKGDNQKYEINMSAEYLHRDYIDIMRTLLHEMVHLHNAVNGIKDCSRGGTYHNKRFKETSEQFGFYYDTDKPDKKHGWSFSNLKPETVKLIENWEIDQTAFELARIQPQKKKKKKSNSIKLECPSCGIKLRATKQGLKVLCQECETVLVES